ncbi:MAG TPA: 30S ribosome-binding factor RbfA [Steroidobacteraceae bacterium]|nr:30S ribosome-binding factor RbfA [Steroidobacteraceae bacterium]
MSEGRSRRLASEIQRVLAALIAREVKDPRIGNVTITAVDVAPDMRNARVFFTPFASPHPPEEVRAGLTRAASFLRGELGRRLALRYAPRLEFVADESAAAAVRLTGLIDRAVAADRAAHPAEAAGADAAGGAAEPGPEDSAGHGPRR